MQLVEDREDLKDARAALKERKLRVEMAAVEDAGGAKRLGDSAEIRERKLALIVADDAECRRLMRLVADLERTVARSEARFERAARALRFYEWAIRNKLTDTLDRLAGRACVTNLEHQLHALVAEATGEKGIYAGESEWIEEKRVG